MTLTFDEPQEFKLIDNMIGKSPINGDQGAYNVVLCADPRFALGAWVAIWSAYESSGGNLAFSLLTTGAGSGPIRKMQDLAKRTGIALPLKFHRLWLVKMADMVGGVSSNAHRLFYPKKCLTRQPLSPSRGEGARRLPVIENPRRIAPIHGTSCRLLGIIKDKSKPATPR
jgi:hypothetical protein